MNNNAWRHAVSAIWDEVFAFRFDHPLAAVPEAGPKDSLHYYLYSERLRWDVMKLDESGVPRAHTRLNGDFYRPGLIAWWGLVKLGHYLRHRDTTSLEQFLIQLDWLEREAVRRPDGATVWPNRFDSLQGRTLFLAPWVSGHDQGYILSAIVRGYRLTKRSSLLKLLENTERIFELGVHDGGVRIPTERGVLYAELPGSPAPGILDGFMTALLGLYDLAQETQNPRACELFEEGMQGLKSWLPYWNYKDKWSWYGSKAYLCPPPYHTLIRLQLGTLGRLLGDSSMLTLSEKWDPQNLSSLDRAEIYMRFLITKNGHRMHHRTWKQSRERVLAAAAAKRRQFHSQAA
jgi:hypothetical protein